MILIFRPIASMFHCWCVGSVSVYLAFFPFLTMTSRNPKSSKDDEWRNSHGRNSSFDQRALRNSTGAKEEFLAPTVDETTESRLRGKDTRQLGIYFVLMVFIGLGNKIFNKLQTVGFKRKSHIASVLIQLL
jgi:hypothetical protein